MTFLELAGSGLCKGLYLNWGRIFLGVNFPGGEFSTFLVQGANFPGGEFSVGANFQGQVFAGANFPGANFQGRIVSGRVFGGELSMYPESEPGPLEFRGEHTSFTLNPLQMRLYTSKWLKNPHPKQSESS